MSFGLRNEPDKFQRALYIILSGVRGIMSLVYLDYAIIISKENESLLDHLDHLLTLLEEGGVKLKLKMRFLFRDNIKYLGQVIHPETVAVSQPAKATRSVREALLLTTATHLKSFLSA